MTPPLEAQASEIRRALALLIDEGATFEIRALASTKYGNGEETLSGYFRDPARAAAEVERLDSPSVIGWYVTMNPVDPALYARRANRIAKVGKDAATKNQHIVRRTRLVFDVDPCRPTGISSTAAEHAVALKVARMIAAELVRLGWPEPSIADSGNGAHVISVIDIPTEDEGLIERVLKASAAKWDGKVDDVAFKIDVTMANPSRITKLYGTPARKGDSVDERPHRMSSVLSSPEDMRPVPRELLEALAATVAPEPTSQPKNPKGARPGGGAIDAAAWLARHGLGVKGSGPFNGKGSGTLYELEACPYTSEHGERGEAFVIQFASGALHAGCHHDGCKRAGWGWEWLRERFEPGAYERRPLRADRAPPPPDEPDEPDERDLPPDDMPPPRGDDAPPLGDEEDPTQRKRPRVDPNDPRPQIVYSTDQPAMADAAIRALAAMGGVYVRGRRLVHVVRDRGSADWFERPDGARIIVPIERDHLLDLLGRAAVWISVRDGVQHLAAPPAWIAPRIMARGEWDLPQLESIADAPVFRADGSIHATPGYDERTRIIFDPGGVAFPTVPTAPTRADAISALAEIVEPFSEFPFKEESDRAATAALILSMVGRAAIDGCVPMFGVQAPTPGSGKGLHASAATMIPTGRPAPLMAPTDDDEETRKRLLSIALAGDPVVVIDNVDGELGSGPLAMAITAGQVSDRLLGSTKMVTATLRPVWCFTGNNVRLKGDLGRRVVPIDLDPKMENPEDRTFERCDLLGYVRANRPRLVVAALTVLRAFHVAGRPAHGLPAKGSFESWDRLVRAAIIWAGGPDPCAGVQRIRLQSDDDLDRLRMLIGAWVAALGHVACTIATAIDRAGDSGDLYSALAAYCPRSGKPEARAIGHALRKVQNRPVNEMTFRHGGIDPHSKVALWVVERMNPAGSAGSAGSVPGPSETRGESAHAHP